MAEHNIPLRPKNYDASKVKKQDADCLTYVAIMNCKNEDAFKLWHPEYLTPEGRLNVAGKNACKQYFSYARHREYLDDMRATLEEYCKGLSTPKVVVDVSENRKDKAVSKLISDCLDAINDNSSLDPETLKDFVTMAKALGVLKEEQEQIEAPRRYLPERCSTCKYKQFIDENVRLGNIEEVNDN